MRNVRFLTWLMISVTWVAGLFILLPPVGIQVNYWIFAAYCLIGPAVTAVAIAFLHRIDRNFFDSAVTAAPIGAVFLAIFALLGYLISAEREARRPFLEHQLETCGILADAAGTLATSGSPERDKAWSKLWILDWGRLAIFADTDFEQVMMEFSDLVWYGKNKDVKLTEPKSVDLNVDLHEPALCVARMCRVMVQFSWSVIPGLVQENADIERHCQEQHRLFINL